MKNKVLLGLGLVFLGSLQAAENFRAIAATEFMPPTYCPGQQMTVAQALDMAEVNALSIFPIASAERMITVAESFNSFRYGIFEAYCSASGERPFVSQVQRCLNHKDTTGNCLAMVRRILVSEYPVKQAHFDWIQKHKTDPAIVAEIAECLGQCYRDEREVRALFAYLDARVESVSQE